MKGNPYLRRFCERAESPLRAAERATTENIDYLEKKMTDLPQPPTAVADVITPLAAGSAHALPVGWHFGAGNRGSGQGGAEDRSRSA